MHGWQKLGPELLIPSHEGEGVPLTRGISLLHIICVVCREGPTGPSLTRREYRHGGVRAQRTHARLYHRLEGVTRHTYECVHAGVRGPQWLLLMPARSASRDYNRLINSWCTLKRSTAGPQACKSTTWWWYRALRGHCVVGVLAYTLFGL